MWPFVLACGVVLGFAFGLIGVGSVFAVPILVYAIGLAPHRAVCTAMLAVSILSGLTVAVRWRRNAIEFEATALVALGGMLGAPIGAWLSRFLSGSYLMLVFAIVLAVIGIRILGFRLTPNEQTPNKLANRTARRTALALTGLVSGVLAGLLGIGGVIVVPALIYFAGIGLHQAITTAQAAIFWIGLSAAGSHFVAGQRVPLSITTLFVVGGIIGMIAGVRVSAALPGRPLEIIFGVGMIAVALTILIRSFQS